MKFAVMILMEDGTHSFVGPISSIEAADDLTSEIEFRGDGSVEASTIVLQSPRAFKKELRAS